MSRTIKGLTINEGYTDLGALTVDVTPVEVSKAVLSRNAITPAPVSSRSNLFLLQCSDGIKIGSGYRGDFTVSNVPGESYSYSLNANTNGFIELKSPLMPVVVLDGVNDIVQLDINGPLASRPDECYIKVADPAMAGHYLYTLTWNLAVNSGKLCVTDGNGNFYQVAGPINVGSNIDALYVSAKGAVYGHDKDASSWLSLGTLMFSKVQSPKDLTSVADGFYMSTPAALPITDGQLGAPESPFIAYSATVSNPEPFKVNVAAAIYKGATPVGTASFNDLVPGSKDYSPISVDCSASVPDTSPTVAQIETVAGSFSAGFKSFLSSKGLSTVNKIQQAGPIKYISGIPGSVPDSDISRMQSHVDLYSFNPSASQNQLLITAGYGDMYKIAQTPKNVFVNAAVATGGLTVFQSAQLHEVSLQTRALIKTRLAGTMVDLAHTNTTYTPVSGSAFPSQAFSNVTNTCGCDDCQSAVSPFSYMMDLLKYCAEHIDHASDYARGGDTGDFINLMTDLFLQPFGTLDVDCDTLHKEFCRVRLVTEILEKLVAKEITAGTISVARQAVLTAERNNYLQITYNNILLQAGTSFNELRDVVTTPAAEKTDAAQKLADKLGIPLYVPPTGTTYTADRMWLTLTGTGLQQLTALNLELVFGFRDTNHDVLTDVPKSLVEEWKEIYLDQVWLHEDYYFSTYSRENVVSGSPSTFNPIWKPIIDPDIMGWPDLTYDTLQFAIDLYKLRKADTDAFIDFYLGDTSVVTRLSADLRGRVLKVLGKNIVGQTLQGNSITINDGTNWIAFNVVNRTVNLTDTDVILQKSTNAVPQPALFQPAGTSPKMRYKRMVVVPAGQIQQITTPYTITWTDPVIADQLTFAQLISDGDAQVYDTSVSGANSLAWSFVDDRNISVTLGSAPNNNFKNGNVTFIYEVEVPLYTTLFISPVPLVDKLFVNAALKYTLLAPSTGMTSPVFYTPWFPPANWFGLTGATNYDKLKLLYQLLLSGNASDDQLSLIDWNLHISTADFTRAMQVLTATETFISNCFTAVKPLQDDLYEMASIFRTAAKAELRDTWVKEEIQHQVAASTPAMLMLDLKFFWAAINEPVSGYWDSRLQTMPATVGAIDANIHTPLIDPELLAYNDILMHPEANPYRSLYTARQAILDTEKQTYLSYLVPYDQKAFTKILNKVNTGAIGTGPAYNVTYSVTPYATLADLIADLQNSDSFKQKAAQDAAWNAFGIGADDFTTLCDTITKYEDPDPALHPATQELEKAVKMLVTGYKRKRLYPTISGSGWIMEEIAGGTNLTTGYPVMYYNVKSMRLAPGRSDRGDRTEWQKTLRLWNRLPFINPDIVPPENIKHFLPGALIQIDWLARKITLTGTYNAIATYLNASITPVSTLFTNYKHQLNLVIARVDQTTPLGSLDFLPYFIDINTRENNGEDIRPYLEQLGIAVAEYRVLWRVYHLLENNGVLLASEFGDIIDILVHIRTKNLSFALVQEEYVQGIILSSDGFKLYTPPIANFPQTDLPTFNPWRAPYQDRSDWLNLLEARIDRENAIEQDWQDGLAEAEDRCMPSMRDALIKALRDDCESHTVTAERLAKTLFVETEDNCCVKHTRVSHAIETIQTLVFALYNGIYDEYATGFTLTAPNFKNEWQWLGAYAQWRSAVFVFLYPENLLYPTLKKLQSPGFSNLSGQLQDANRFSPEDACRAAKDYQHYLDDLEEMNIICTASAPTFLPVSGADPCCGDEQTKQMKFVNFFIAQAKSGVSYWSFKEFDGDIYESHSFWQKLPLDTNVKVTGCYVLGARDEGWGSINTTLWLFYSVTKDSKLKMGFIKKDLTDPLSSWTEPDDTDDLPKFSIPNLFDDLLPSAVTACQHGLDWEVPSFIFQYNYGSDIYYAHQRLNHHTNKFDTLLNGTSFLNYKDSPATPSDKLVLLTGIRHTVTRTNSSDTHWWALTMVFNKKIVISGFAVDSSAKSFSYNNIIGAYESKEEGNTLIVVYTNTSNVVCIDKIRPDFTNATPHDFSASTATTLSVTGQDFADLLKIYPVFSQSPQTDKVTVAVKCKTGPLLGGVITPTSGANNNYQIGKLFGLVPETVIKIAIESGACIANIDGRTSNIKLKMDANMNADAGGSPTGSYKRTAATREYMFEAYYFVPMLIALDQHNRGQYDTALEWYRTVYDYRNNLATKRKVFYGLFLEETVANTTTYDSHWIKDPLNPHLIAQTRTNAYTKYTLMNIIQCITAWADRQFTLDTIETVPVARELYSAALDLLNSVELGLIDDPCAQKAGPCLTDDITLPADGSWNNLFATLQNELASIQDPTMIAYVAGLISTILNGSGSLETRFANAFQAIVDNPLPVVASGTVTSVMAGMGQRSNDAARYVFAANSAAQFTTNIADRYAVAVANLSGVQLQAITTTPTLPQISWLTEDIPHVAVANKFEFAKSSGVQNFSGVLAYNPLSPNDYAVTANTAYSNPNAFMVYQSNDIPYDPYTPLIDYQFCLPLNPVYKSLQLKANLELYKIFNCRNIAGMVRELSVYSAPTDSTTGIPVIGASGNLVLPGTSNFTPSQYRFKVLMDRAKQIVAQAQQMESLFLAALEKEDAENYSQLRAKQDLETAKGTVKLQDLRISQASSERDLANLQVDKATFTQSHYQNLLASGLNAYEVSSLALLQASAIAEIVATVAFFSAGAANFATPMHTGDAFANAASGIAGVATALSTQSSVLSQLASFQRRSEEWGFQKDLAGFDVSIANQQVKIADDNIRVVTQEREIAQLNMDHASDTLEFLKTKFTNAQLYQWMGGVLEKSYSFMLNLGTAMAKTAEGQLYFERQEQAGPFILNDYWETPSSGFTSGSSGGVVDRRGLTGSARLLVDLTKLDQYAFDTNKRKLQMSKVISLSQNFPAEFQTFKETGVFNFELTNKFFDYDFPGHYLRLINNVKTTVVGLFPVYDSIKATLTTGSTSYTVIGGTTFQKIPIHRADTDSVALTSANNATGLFEMQPAQGDLLNPFEGMGVESRWEFKMPQFSNRFDFTNIADVLINVEYTALDSYQYRYQVLQDLDNKITFNRGFSFRNDFPDQWYELGDVETGTTPFGVNFEFKRENFPQGINNLRLNGDITVYFVRDDGFTDEIKGVDIKLYAPGPDTTPALDTNNGKLPTGPLMKSLGYNPLVSLRMVFSNNFTNREIFSTGKVKDILILVGCKAELKSYPL